LKGKMREYKKIKNLISRIEAWIISFVLLFLYIFEPAVVSAESESYSIEFPETYHTVTFISENPNCTFSIGEMELSTPSDYYEYASVSDATGSNAAAGMATASETDEDGILTDGPVYDGYATVSNASQSNGILTGLREVKVFVKNRGSLTSDQIPEIKISSKYIGANGWKDENNTWYASAGLLSTGITQDLTLTVNTYSKRIMMLAASGFVCKIGSQGYTTLAQAVTEATNGDTIEMLVQEYTLPQQINIDGKNITITKAAENAATLPYEGTPGTIPTLKRSTQNFSIFDIKSSSVVTISDICFDGQNAYSSAQASGNSGIIRVEGLANVTLDGAASIINVAGYQAAAILVGSSLGSGTLTMQGNSSIHDCLGRNSGVIDEDNGSTITLKDHASIYNCTGNDTSSAVFMRSSTTKSTFNLTGYAKIYNNTSTGNGAESAVIACHPNTAIINISGHAEISGNTFGCSAIELPTGSTLNITGGLITGNTARAGGTSYSGGIYAAGGSAVRISGTPVIKGNTNNATTAQKDLYLSTNAMMTVTSDMDPSASVGIYCPGNMNIGNQFGITTNASSAAVKGLYAFFADTNTASTDYLCGTAGSANKVVWGYGTCQIIRNNALYGIYPTLKEACDNAVSGDTIEVFKSHTVTAASGLTNLTGVTIRTAPTSTAGPTVTGSRTFSPASGETDRATVLRGPALTGTAGLTISGGSVTTGNIIFDGNKANCSATTPLISISNSANVTIGEKTVIRNSTNTTGSQQGTINLNGTNTLNITKAEMSGNNSGMGGAVLSQGTNTVNITESTFSNNTAAVAGGAIASMGGALNVSKSTFTGNQNTDSANGGGAVMATGSMLLNESTFSGNSGGSGSAIYANTLTMTGTNTITGNHSNVAGGGAVFINSSAAGALTMSGAPKVTGNTDSSNAASNVRLLTNAIINAAGTLTGTAGAVGVSVASGDHVSGHKFVENYTQDGTTVSRDAAAANKPVFKDDLTPSLNIGANREDAGQNAAFDTYIYFRPPTRLQFTKKSDGINHAPVSGAAFHIYRWVGTGTVPTTYESDTNMAADANWSRVTYTNQDKTQNTEKGNVFTSGTDGNTDCGYFDDKSYRIVEVSTENGYNLPAGEWNMTVNSAAADPGKFTFTTIVNGTRNIDTDYTYDFNNNETTGTSPYSLYNYYSASTLTIKYMNQWEPYANLTKHGTFTVLYVGTDSVQHTVTQSIETGHSFTISDVKAGGAVIFTQTDSDGYTITESHVVPAGETITNYGGSDKIWYYKPVRGDTLITVTNSRKEIVPTGVEAGQTDPYLWLAGILLWICFLLFRKKSS